MYKMIHKANAEINKMQKTNQVSVLTLKSIKKSISLAIYSDEFNSII